MHAGLHGPLLVSSSGAAWPPCEILSSARLAILLAQASEEKEGRAGVLNLRVSWPTEPALGPYRMWGDFSEAETHIGGTGRGALSQRGLNRGPT